MLNHRWSTFGTLDEICQDLHNHHFPAKIFLLVSKDSGWYRIDNDTWLMVQNGEYWQLYYWPRRDPRPFLRTIINLKGFK